MVTRDIAVVGAASSIGIRPYDDSGRERQLYRAPAALRALGLVESLGARDLGDVTPPPYVDFQRPGRRPRNEAGVARYSFDLARRVAEAAADGSFVLVLGGDCSIVLGSLLGARSARHVDGLAERIDERGRIRPVAVEPGAVHEERGRSIDAALHASAKVLANDFFVRTIGERACHRRRVDADVLRVADEIVILEGVLMLEQHVVHRPEVSVALNASRLGGLRGVRCMWMLLLERKMAEHHAQLVAHLALHLLHDGIRHSAVRALEIPVFDERERRVHGAAHMVVRTDRHEEGWTHGRASSRRESPGCGSFATAGRCTGALSLDSAPTMPSAPGFTSIGER